MATAAHSTYLEVNLAPMLATPAKTPDWSYEVKWDGYRALAVKDGTRVRLISRRSNDITRQYAAVGRAVASIQAKQAVVDGELVAVDAQGRPSFQALQHRAKTPLPVVYYAFDILSLEARDLTRRPLEERRTKLEQVIGDTSSSTRCGASRLVQPRAIAERDPVRCP